MVLMRSTYLADAYETYSSSANAAQSFARNILAAVFPLFAYQFVRPSHLNAPRSNR
jgi:hypothetical protein